MTNNAIIQNIHAFRTHIAHHNPFTVVSSAALYTHGFPVPIHDVDLEIYNPDPIFIQALETLTAATPAGTTPPDYKTAVSDPQIHKTYNFTFQNVPYNVWWVHTNTRPVLYRDFLAYADIPSILAYKKLYGRPKDYQTILTLITEICR